jgi:cytochrome c oxidase subunit 3
MSATVTHVAHHFDDAGQQYTAANLGMWLFLATEVLFFGGLFCGYTQYRYWYPREFAAGSHHLDLVLGTINTLVLLSSSLTMALAVRAAQTNDRTGTARCLLFTILLGSIFLGIKVYEYYHKFDEHLVPGRSFSLSAEHAGRGESDARGVAGLSTRSAGFQSESVELFFSFYFGMTGLHATHMVIGIAVLAVLLVAARRGTFSADYFTPVEMTGLYWHFVDIVWVFLFPLLYLIR